MLDAPEWILPTLTLIMAIGLPIWIIISWIYEVTPEGIEKTAKVSENELVTEITNKRLNIFIIVSLSIAVIVMGLKLSNFFSDSDKEFSIAVLPFDDMSQANDNEWFCDGVTESILTKLSKINGLTVLSRTSVKQYKNHEKTIPEIAAELGVDYILEGSVRKQNNDLLITAQLINANDKHIWADDFEGTKDDIFAIQQNVAEKIVNKLKINLTPEEKKSLKDDPTQNKKAYDLYMKGLHFSDMHTHEDFKTSIDLFQQAIDLDPDFAEAYAEMSTSYFISRGYIDEIKNRDEYIENINNAKRYADKSLQLDPDLAIANIVKGSFLMWIDNDEEKAKKYFEKALVSNNNNPRVYFILSHYYIEKNPRDLEKAINMSNMAAKLDPFSIDINYANIRYLAENNYIVEAEANYKKSARLFSERDKFKLKDIIIRNKGEKLSLQNRDWSELIDIYLLEIQKDPNNYFHLVLLGNAYDEILNDNVNYLKYAKRAYALNSSDEYWANSYLNALLENDEFKEAELLMNSTNYKNVISTTGELKNRFHFYYNQGNYKKAQEILKDTVIPKNYWFRIANYAQLGKRNKIDSLLKEKEYNNNQKAMVYAILKEKDSMYHYLGKLDDLKFVNGRREYDSYRKEERYKALLKKNYLPITHWNE
jgi:TolB-like protein